MDDFLRGYLDCMVWLTPEDEFGKPYDPPVTIEDIAPEALDKIRAECTDFYDANRDTWENGGWSDAQAGHDFYLTRNGHGGGFWDRSFNVASEACGKILTENSRPYHDQCLYRGDDGKFYV